MSPHVQFVSVIDVHLLLSLLLVTVRADPEAYVVPVSIHLSVLSSLFTVGMHSVSTFRIMTLINASLSNLCMKPLREETGPLVLRVKHQDPAPLLMDL